MMRKKQKPFQLQRYAESLAWRAFLNSKDQAFEIGDFLQEARMVLLRAARDFDSSRGAKLETYSTSRLIHHFKHMAEKRRNSPNLVATEKLSEGAVFPDEFWARVTDVLTSRGNDSAKRLVRALLCSCFYMRRCSLAELRRVSGLTPIKFRTALVQLSRF